MGKLLVIDLRGERIQGLALRVDKLYPLQDKVESNSFNEMFVRKFEDQVDLDDEDVMDMYEIKAHLLENGIDMDLEDF
ncbi:hypothetical protein Bca52824_086174 [Brassica carinata]|uniref:Uncharacterized protein n=1 Tax=Brassica carinata TaxID=52824 RepID=A0A8X7TNJ9_BRACI|nr:hypothetical protein Bca52824_086174 [Brassica carinata]